MPVFALYNFNDADDTARDSALGNGAQLGHYVNGATAVGGQAVLDGVDDLVKIYQDPTFQMDRGTLEINFTLSDAPLTAAQTVLSRDSVGTTDGGYRVDIQPDGSVVISHETPTGTETFGTAAGFATPGDTINLSYSWDQAGTGGVLNIVNQTTSATFTDTVPNTLTMDMGGINQPWMVGAGQTNSDADILNNVDNHFAGSVEFFSLSDTVDNTGDAPTANPDQATTNEDVPVIIDVLLNDTDPNGDVLTVTTATSPNGTITINPNGTLNYTPAQDFNGTDTITYTVTDPAGNTSSSTVTVLVNPINDAPVATDDTAATAVNQPVTFGVLGNDTDVDGDVLSVLGTPTSADGTVVVNGDGTLTFTPDTGFTGVAEISYQITDGNGGTDTAIVSVQVGPVRSPDGIVDGTTAGDLIDNSYIGDPNGDMVDANDALLPGQTGNDDIIRAGAGDDTVLAGNGNDSITAGNGNDSVDAGAGNDTLDGGRGADTLDGGAGNDSVIGGAGDSLVGGEGDDTIQGNGASEIYGDAPSSADLPNIAYPGDYTADVNPANNEDLINAGTSGSEGVTVYGGDDNDTVNGGDNADTIYGGIDDDRINAGAGDDSVIGGQGRDTVVGGAGNDVISGDDTLPTTHDLADTAGDLVTNNNTDSLSGGLGDDTIYGQDDDDTLAGGAGNDVLDGGNDDDLMTGDAGNDRFIGGQGNDTMTGGADMDNFVGANAGDVVDGSETGVDNDTLDLRGLGPLTIAYDAANPENGVVTFRDAAGNPTGTMRFTNIENVLTETTPRDGIVFGTGGDDVINGSYTGDNDGDMVDANDALLPGEVGNDDIILAGAGNDTVMAGNGDDSVDGDTGNDSVVGGEGNDTLNGDEGNDTLAGNSGNDTLNGGLGNDSLNGGVGDDSLIGDEGNDTLFGALGNDTLSTGNGNDLADGGNGNDVIDTSGGGVAPLPDMGYPGLYPSDTNPTNDLDTVYGGAGDDTIRTGDDADLIAGGQGNDIIDAGFDNDTVEGGMGNDTIIGGEGADVIDGGQNDDLIYGGYGEGTPDSVNIPDDEGDLLPNNGNDSIEGGMGNDTIYGLDDNDTIDGGQGNDYLVGGIDEDFLRGDLGNDTLYGGHGSDTIYGGADQDRIFVSSANDAFGDVVDGNEGGDDYDVLDLNGIGRNNIVITRDPTNSENGHIDFYDAAGQLTGGMDFTNIEHVIPCFTPGTLIATPKGEVPVELLKAGDRIITRDNGIQEIRWTGRKDMGWHDLVANPHLKPVMIRKGSLGNGLPEQDMMVSPNHRVLVANDRTALYFDEHEVLVSAKHLVASKGIDAIDSVGTSYIHFMFDRHEVVLSNGAWTESFQPGDYTLKGMGNAQRSEIFDLFPELKTEAGLEGYSSARRTLKRHEAMLLVK
jgi:Ca2+-binding RTX toxin-like protein